MLLFGARNEPKILGTRACDVTPFEQASSILFLEDSYFVCILERFAEQASSNGFPLRGFLFGAFFAKQAHSKAFALRGFLFCVHLGGLSQLFKFA